MNDFKLPYQDLVKSIADKKYGGHYTLFSFTTGYAFIFGTPNSRDDVSELIPADTVELAIREAVLENVI